MKTHSKIDFHLNNRGHFSNTIEYLYVKSIDSGCFYNGRDRRKWRLQIHIEKGWVNELNFN